jgi:hypothetical protein
MNLKDLNDVIIKIEDLVINSNEDNDNEFEATIEQVERNLKIYAQSIDEPSFELFNKISKQIYLEKFYERLICAIDFYNDNENLRLMSINLLQLLSK